MAGIETHLLNIGGRSFPLELNSTSVDLVTLRSRGSPSLPGNWRNTSRKYLGGGGAPVEVNQENRARKELPTNISFPAIGEKGHFYTGVSCTPNTCVDWKEGWQLSGLCKGETEVTSRFGKEKPYLSSGDI